MPKLDLVLIKSRLFENHETVSRLARDYAFPVVPRTADELSKSLTTAFGQVTASEPVTANRTPNEVFRAATRALGSNSRPWSTFLSMERQFSELLCHYDPARTWRAAQRGALPIKVLVGCLPGQTGGRDARAVLQWAKLLASMPDYYRRIADLYRSFAILGVEENEIMPCVAGFMGHPPRVSPASAHLTKDTSRMSTSAWKLPGMGPVLGSEFLRNLGWSGFKPDRHIVRLFRRWLPDVVQESRLRANELAGLVGRRNKALFDFLTYSLAGIRVTPSGTSLSAVDNVVWALGAYVERKGHETDCQYRID